MRRADPEVPTLLPTRYTAPPPIVDTTSFPVVKSTDQAAGLEALLTLARPVEAAEAGGTGARRQLRVSLPLLAILTVQATLSFRLIHIDTAFTDEALYLWAGHMEWAHVLHGTPLPPFPTFFSGSPLIYPPLGALADSIGGLAGARLLSMCFMLGVTALLWATASRLFGKRAGCFAAALFAVLGPTVHLGSLATYDAMALFFLALSAWLATGARERWDGTGWIAGAAAALLVANAAKYATVLFDPVVLGLAFLTAYPRPGGRLAVARLAQLTFYVVTGAILLFSIATYGNGYYITGIEITTLTRVYGTVSTSVIMHDSLVWLAAVMVPAACALVGVFREQAAQRRFLLLLLVGAGCLVPLEQVRIHTLTSLNKHVDFGAWFAAAAAGYAIDRLLRLLRRPVLQAVGTATLAGVVAWLAQPGFAQARSIATWANSANLITALRPALQHTDGAVLIDVHSIAEYYLPPVGAEWYRWSSTASLILPSGRTVNAPIGAEGRLGPYLTLMRRGYFSVVELNSSTPLTQGLTTYLSADSRYRLLATGPYGSGVYRIWERRQ